MLKVIKIRLYPNKTQEIYIGKLLGCYRFVYNKCLDKKKNAYLNDKSNLGLKELGNYFHQDLTKSKEYSFLTEHNTKVLKQSIINLLDAYKRFFINGNGFPKFKSKHNNKQSCRFPLEAVSLKNNYLSGKLTITTQLKNLKFKCSNEYKQYLNKYKDNIKSATLIKTSSGNYFLSILVDSNIEKQLPMPINQIIGIDMGIKDFVVTSKNQKFENIKSIRNNEKRLIRLQKQLSKKVKGSHNRNKERLKLAKKYEKINNIKENYLHQVSNQLLNENQVIVMEDLNVNGMLKNHQLAKSIQELSLCEFKRKLLYKANWYNRTVIEIDRFYPSSKLCGCCGYKNKELKLSDRNWTCPNCKTIHDRDYNAAKNIENEGNKILIGNRKPESTFENYPTKESSNTFMDEHSEMNLRSSDRLNQKELSTNNY
jgi:putative transposase